MPRRFAPLLTSIWDNDGFRDLSPSAQRMYLQVLSQKRLSLCGVVPYQVRNWARGCTGITEDDIERDIAELIDRDYVWVDRQTEELVVRTMIKHDPPRGARSIAGMWNDWREIDSLEIRRRVVHSLPTEIWDHSAVDPPEEAKVLRKAPYEGASESSYTQENQQPASSFLLPPSSCHLPPSSALSSDRDSAPQDDDDRIEKIVSTVVDIRIQQNPAKSNPTNYRRTVEQSVRAERLGRIIDLAAMCRPDTPISAIAAAAESGNTQPLAHWLYVPEQPTTDEPQLTREQRQALIQANKESA